MCCSGDIVGLSLMSGDGPADSIASGIVSHVTQLSVSIAYDESNESLFDLDDAAQYKLIKLANDVTYRRMQRYFAVKVYCNLKLWSLLLASLSGIYI